MSLILKFILFIAASHAVTVDPLLCARWLTVANENFVISANENEPNGIQSMATMHWKNAVFKNKNVTDGTFTIEDTTANVSEAGYVIRQDFDGPATVTFFGDSSKTFTLPSVGQVAGLTSNGQFLITTDRRRSQVSVHDVKSGAVVLTREAPSASPGLSINVSGKFITVVDVASNHFELFELEAGKAPRKIMEQDFSKNWPDAVGDVVYDHQQSLLAVYFSSTDRINPMLFKLKNGKFVPGPKLSGANATGENHELLPEPDSETQEFMQAFMFKYGARGALSPSGKHMFASWWRPKQVRGKEISIGFVDVYSTFTGKLVRTLESPHGTFFGYYAFTKNERYLATASDGYIYIYDLKDASRTMPIAALVTPRGLSGELVFLNDTTLVTLIIFKQPLSPLRASLLLL